MKLQCQQNYNNSDLVMQSLYIIIVLVFCVNTIAINVIVNQAEYQWRCENVSFRKVETCRVMYGAV